MTGRITVTVKDRGYTYLVNKHRRLDNQGADVGYWGTDKYPPRGNERTVPTTVHTAMWNEFGMGVPERPFIRTTWTRHGDATFNFIRSLYYQFLRDPAFSHRPFLTQLARYYRVRMQMTIQAAPTWATPLAPETIARKGHSRPLLERYLLINRIRMRFGRRVDR